MTHDFAKIRPEPLLDKRPEPAPPAWSMMFTGILVGMAIGVFSCVVFYLSGNVPPLQASTPLNGSAVAATIDRVDRTAAEEPVARDKETLELEFYRELPSYEVPVEVEPVAIADPNAPLAKSYLLQSGAFQQRNLADLEAQRQQELGLDVRVRSEALPGRTLYLIQSGPYTTRGELDRAEQILRRNSIRSLRTSMQD